MLKSNFCEIIPGVHKIKADLNIKTEIEEKLLSSVKVQIFARHGNSAFLSIWSLEELINSNHNLAERRPDRNWDDLYCPFDLRQSLRGLAVTIV